MPAISIIMPVLNEARILRQTLEALIPRPHGAELVVSDGGSDDDTLSIAREYADHVVHSSRGRGVQLHSGAMAASGDTFLFLHADCRLPEGAFDLIDRALSGHGVSAGAFDLSIDAHGLSYRIIERMANMRSRLTGVPYGDQALFMRRNVYDDIGGYARIPLMEDIEIAARIKRTGRIAFIDRPVRASARRWIKGGVINTTLTDWRLAFSYTVLGADPLTLARKYGDAR